MHISYYDVTVPVFKKNLLITKALLQKGLEHALASGMTETTFLEQRLAPDMFPLMKQVQMVTDNAKGSTFRLAGLEVPVVADTETTVAELLARIDMVIAYLENFTPEQFAGAAEQKITLSYIPGMYQKGADYLADFVLPNFFFHMSIIYALLRSQGVTLGKMNFLGSLQLHSVE